MVERHARSVSKASIFRFVQRILKIKVGQNEFRGSCADVGHEREREKRGWHVKKKEIRSAGGGHLCSRVDPTVGQ